MKSPCGCARFVIFVLVSLYSLESSGMLVRGRVLTEDDKPVENASVYLDRVDGPATARPKLAATDQYGRYQLTVQDPGAYAVHAFKPDAGYPDIVFAFNLAPNQQLKQITVVPGHDLTDIEIKLGPKPGNIHFKVTDQKTHQTLATAKYKLCQVLAPSYCLETSAAGEFDFSVPSTEVTVDISSEGHAKFQYSENGKPYISLKPGESRTIDVTLTPQ